MTDFYSQRKAEPPSCVVHDLSLTARRRILSILNDAIGDERAMRRFIQELEGLLHREYGELHIPGYDALRGGEEPVVVHFLWCPAELALDFIEACFRLSVQCGGQKTVDAINRVFRQEGVGYELTPFRGRATPKGSVAIGAQTPPDQLPTIIRIDDQTTHAEIIAPGLRILANPVFAVANAEMLKAYSEFRAGRYEDAITQCSSAFESVLKTICDEKGWAYDSQKDTCSTLVDICHANGLFPSFYVDLFKRVGTIRNKLGDAHGRGPVLQFTVDASHAEHLLHMTMSHIIFLCRLAGFH